jgi:asparagine synthase (glutamine-hydrolysing)
MCGIFGLFDARFAATPAELRAYAIKRAKLLRHRGPDGSGVHVYMNNNNGKSRNAVLCHERLSILDPERGAQPLKNKDETVIMVANGEIYNHQILRDGLLSEYEFRTHSDSEVILGLYEKLGNTPEFVQHVDGMFAFMVWDERKELYFISRDHMGICPLYIGFGRDGSVMVASEMKALHSECETFQVFPPGHYYDSSKREFLRWYEPIWYSPRYIPSEEFVFAELRERFERAVDKCMMSDVPWGVLLSGGLDSSLVAACAARRINQKAQHRLYSFSVGLKGSPDLAAARKAADYLGTEHYSFEFTVQEGLDAIEDVIYFLETYDTTTIRAATPMYLMARKIKALGVKMVISGEGSDEALAGYLYFHKAPNKVELHKECVSKLQNLHYYDCLRANKAMSAFGVEPRVPFLDRDFLEYAMTIDPEWKMCKIREGDEQRGKIEKYILRKAFDTQDKPYLPEEILWRQKEQFSDGVGYSWIDSLRAQAQESVPEAQWNVRAERFPYNTPATKEAYVYRDIFEQLYPSQSARATVPGGPSVACSTPAAIAWDESFKKLASGTGGECSGRSVAGVHASAYKDALRVVNGEINLSESAAQVQSTTSRD